MVKVEDIETMGWRKAIKGMRNPMNSWDTSDSEWKYENIRDYKGYFVIGQNDLDLACRLIKAGPEHRKFLRMIHVQMDITGPLYWWKEMDTYKVGTTANSCSTMHKIAAKEFTFADFSCEHLIGYPTKEGDYEVILGTSPIEALSEITGVPTQIIKEYNIEDFLPMGTLSEIIDQLNGYRKVYLKTKDKKYWWQMIQLLPSSYNQLRTWDGNMETILSILHQRAHHKLNTDWEPFRQACFDNIPYCKEFYEAMYGKEEN